MRALHDIELRHLVALQAVAAERSFGRAARRLGFTQSAVSQQIAALERVIGAPVFDRPGGPKPVALTPVGETLLRHADVVLDRVAVAERDIADLLAGRRDRLTIGTFQSASVKVLPNAIRALRAERPDVEITLFEHDDIRELAQRLLDGELSLTFIVGPYADERLACEWFGPDRFVVMSPVGAPDAPIAPVELQHMPLVGWHDNPCQQIIDEALRTHGVSPRYVFRSTDNGAVQAMVRAGMGHAVMPFLAIEPDDPGIVVRKILPAIPDRIVGIARRADTTTSAAATRFIEVARDAFATLVAS